MLENRKVLGNCKMLRDHKVMENCKLGDLKILRDCKILKNCKIHLTIDYLTCTTKRNWQIKIFETFVFTYFLLQS